MRTKSLFGALTVTAVVGATVVGGAGAGASTAYFLVGFAGGAQVRVAHSTVTSDLTASSTVATFRGGVSDTDTTASVSVASVLRAGAVQTSAASRAIDGGYEIVSKATVADVSLLGGAIRIKAVETTGTAKVVDGVPSFVTSTDLVGLSIAGVHLPVRVPPNFGVTIPGVATVILDFSMGAAGGGQAVTLGAGLVVTLLHNVGDYGSGATVFLNPVYSALAPFTPKAHSVYGHAYGTSVDVNVGQGVVRVKSDPTAPITFNGDGTNGVTRKNNVAGLDLSPALQVGAVTDTGRGLNGDSNQDAETTSEVAGVNLLGGLITADVISSDAHVHGAPGGPYTVTGSSGLINLTIAGNSIPIRTAPNTTISVGHIATVTINEQVAAGNGITVRALDIQILKQTHGLPAGAEIQVATSSVLAG